MSNQLPELRFNESFEAALMGEFTAGDPEGIHKLGVLASAAYHKGMQTITTWEGEDVEKRRNIRYSPSWSPRTSVIVSCFEVDSRAILKGIGLLHDGRLRAKDTFWVLSGAKADDLDPARMAIVDSAGNKTAVFDLREDGALTVAVDAVAARAQEFFRPA